MTNNVIEMIKIGTLRKRWIELEPGTYATSADECMIVKRRIGVQVEEEFRFEYPNIRKDPQWQLVAYDITSIKEIEQAISKPHAALPTTPRWWRRLGRWLLRRPKPATPEFPAARLLEPHLAKEQRG